MSRPAVTLLNSMLDADFARAVERSRDLGLSWVDLKDNILGRGVADLSDAEAGRAAQLLAAAGQQVWCLSTSIFDAEIESGEAAFRARFSSAMERILPIARVLRPRMVRLIAAHSNHPGDGLEALLAAHPWVVPLYQQAVAAILGAGFAVTIENESSRNVLASASDVRHFFRRIGRRPGLTFTWDAVNMWQNGTPPSIAVYEDLRDLLGYFHVKGGRSEPGPTELQWKSHLADATWPLAEVTRRIVADGTSPVICINPPHGVEPENYSADVEADIRYLTGLIYGF